MLGIRIIASNSLFSQGLIKSDIYDEARRFIASRNQEENLNKIDFLKNKYSLVIDFRTVDQEDVVNSGRKLMGTEAGGFLK